MPSFELAMPLSRPRDGGPKPTRQGNHPDKHKKTRTGSRTKPSSLKSPIAAKGGQCEIDGVTYRYDDLPYSPIHCDGKSPEQVIAEMSPEIRRNFGIIALVPDAAVAVLEGVRREIVEVIKCDDPDEGADLGNVTKPGQAPSRTKREPSTAPERTLDELRKELLNLLLRAREKASQTETVKRRVRGKKGERMDVERRGTLSRADRIRLRLLKSECRASLSRVGVILPPAMGSRAWFEMLEERLAA